MSKSRRSLLILLCALLPLVGSLSVAPARAAIPAVRSTGVAAWGTDTGAQLGVSRTRCCEFTPFATPTLNVDNVRAIAAGEATSVAVRRNGTVWFWGRDLYGPLSKPAAPVWTPHRVSGLTRVVAVSVGQWHALALDRDGAVWSWGQNYGGQLGTGTTAATRVPTRVLGLPRISMVAAGGNESVALAADGSVWTWGRLGSGPILQSATPTRMTGLSDAVDVATGGTHVLAVRHDGTVWGWGENYVNELGRRAPNRASTPVQVMGPHGVGVLSGIKAVAAGTVHSVALSRNGLVYIWGAGQLFPGGVVSFPTRKAGIDRVTAISAGAGHDLALRADATVWGWGGNLLGELGTGTRTLTGTCTCIVSPVQVRGLLYARGIAAGSQFSLAMTGRALSTPRPPTPRACVDAMNTHGVPRSVAVGNHTLDITSDPVTGHVFVLNSGSYDQLTGWYVCTTSITMLDGTSGRILQNTTIGHGSWGSQSPMALAVHPSAGKLLAIDPGDTAFEPVTSSLGILDTRTGHMLHSLGLGGQTDSVLVDERTFRAGMSLAGVGFPTSTVVQVAVTRGIVTHSTSLPQGGSLVAVDQLHNRMFLLSGNVLITMDGGTGSVIGTTQLPPGSVQDVVVDGTTGRVFVAEVGMAPHEQTAPPDSITVLDSASGALLHSYFPNPNLAIGRLIVDERAGAVLSFAFGGRLSLLDPTDGHLLRTIPNALGYGAFIGPKAVDPRTGRVFIVSSPTTITALDPGTWKIARRIPAGGNTTMLTIDSKTHRVFTVTFDRIDRYVVHLFCSEKSCR